MTDLQTTFAAIDDHVRERMRIARTPGLVLALTDATQTLHLSAFGLREIESGKEVTPDTRFEIGSIGKCFTAIAILQAWESGLIDLDAPVTQYLPWFEVHTATAPITMHHLLTHTAGLPEGTDFSPDPRAEIWKLRQHEMPCAPGERFCYSNTGYKILGLVLASVTGHSYPEVIEKRILRPTGMQQSEAVITHASRFALARGYQGLHDDRPFHSSHSLVPAPWLETDSGDGSIVATAEDMARFARMLLNRGRVNCDRSGSTGLGGSPGASGSTGASGGGGDEDGRILTDEGFERLIRPVIAGDDWHYAYGLVTYEEEGAVHIGHGGDMPGYEASLRLDLTNGLGLVVMMTTPPVRGLPAPIMQTLRANLLGRPSVPLPDIPAPDTIEQAGELAGTYRSAEKSFTLIPAGRGLRMEYRGERVIVESRGDDCLYVPHPDFDRFLLCFGRAEDATASAASSDAASSAAASSDAASSAATSSDATSACATTASATIPTDRPVVEAMHGADWYRGERYTGSDPAPAPPAWRALCGHYRAHNPWISNFRVVTRRGCLLLIHPDGDEAPLIPLDESSFRVGDDPHSPERIDFDWLVDGRSLRATLSGCEYYRFFTP